MSSIRKDARRRGLRVAAQVAAITGFVAAGAAFSQAAEPPRVPVSAGGDRASAPEESGADSRLGSDEASAQSPADRLTDALKVRNAGNCGCAPCWGPPAPPAMRPELFDFADFADEEPS